MEQRVPNPRFDVAGLLILTSIPETISAKLPVLVEEKRFLVYVFEESLGETIFSQGLDRTRAGNKARGDINSEGSCSSTVPCICTNTKSRMRFALSEYLSSYGKIAVSKSPVFNDDGHSNPSGYKKVGWQLTRMLGMCLHLGSKPWVHQWRQKTALIKRREDLETIGSKLALKKSLQAKLDLLDHHLKAGRGPILNGPTLDLDQGQNPSPVADVCKPIISTSNVDCLEGLKPIKDNKASTKHKQPRGLKLFNKRKGPHNKHSMLPSANAMKNRSQEKAIKLISSAEFLHDSNIANMNHISSTSSI
ncbi:hypothetical protein Ancab_009839, partial [Ancistrocladus abbreviatus]